MTVNKTVLKQVLNRVERMEKFVLKQTPEICQQMVVEAKLDCYFTLIGNILLFTLLFGIAAFSMYKIVAHVPTGNSYSDDLSGWTIMAAITGLTSVLPIGFGLYAVQQLIYLKKCTKLFVVRQIRNLL